MKTKQFNIYALYKGEHFLCEGTIDEIAARTGKSENFLLYMTYPAYERKCQKTGGANRLVMVSLED